MATEVKGSSSNKQNLKNLSESFQVCRVLIMISPRWKMHILFRISQGDKQFGLLKKALPTLSDQILGKRLKELVIEGLIDKAIIKDNNQNQTVYLITKKGSELLEVLNQLDLWGKAWQI
jgi:DNA-binding HxlR family transcriptional regulator